MMMMIAYSIFAIRSPTTATTNITSCSLVVEDVSIVIVEDEIDSRRWMMIVTLNCITSPQILLLHQWMIRSCVVLRVRPTAAILIGSARNWAHVLTALSWLYWYYSMTSSLFLDSLQLIVMSSLLFMTHLISTSSLKLPIHFYCSSATQHVAIFIYRLFISSLMPPTIVTSWYMLWEL